MTMAVQPGHGDPASPALPKGGLRGRRRWVTPALLAVVAAVVGCLVVPGVVHAVRESRKAQCTRQLKQLGRALYAYHDAHGHFPAAAITGKGGAPLLSWRIAILPQLGYRDLFEQFRRDEPWDSPHNRALLGRMPAEFRCPSLRDRRPGVTGYQAVVGPKASFGSIGTMFEPARGVEIREVTDGASNTVMVVETDRAVPWTRPDDLRYDPDGPLPALGSGHQGGVNALFADGTMVRFLKSTIAPLSLRAILTRDGGEVIGG